MNSQSTTTTSKRLIFSEIVLLPKSGTEPVYTSLRICDQRGAYGVISLYAARAFGLIALSNVRFDCGEGPKEPVFLKSSGSTPLKLEDGRDRLFFEIRRVSERSFTRSRLLPVDVYFHPKRGRWYLNPLLPDSKYEVQTVISLT